MELKDAVKMVEKKKIIKGMYLCSAITFVNTDLKIEYWELNYFDQKTNNITRIHVKQGVELKGSDKPLKEKDIKKINLKDVKITASQALKTAEKHEKEEYKQPIQRIFLSLQKDEKQFWSVGLITKNLQIVQIKVDAKSGKIFESKLHALFEGKAM